MNNIHEWNNKYPKGKAPLSWNLSDYLFWGDEPPSCVVLGVSEGQALKEGEIEEWARETYHTLYILREECPDKFDEQFGNFVLDLEYLRSLGKISPEDLIRLKDRENLNLD
jgi:hypothetical protein